MRNEIRDSRNFVVGYSQDTSMDIQYWSYTKGYIGRYDKASGYWYWMSGSKIGQRGPHGDIGYAEVLRAEGTR